jgi:hypothetical protein
MDLIVKYAQQPYNSPYFPMPSNESIAKMQSAGISRDDIVRIKETWSDVLAMENEVLTDNLGTCYKIIQNGSSSRNEFVSCQSLIYSLRNHEASTIAENTESLSVLNSSKRE